MIRDYSNDYHIDFLLLFKNRTRVVSFRRTDFMGIQSDEKNLVFDSSRKLFGPVVMTNWSD